MWLLFDGQLVIILKRLLTYLIGWRYYHTKNGMNPSRNYCLLLRYTESTSELKRPTEKMI